MGTANIMIVEDNTTVAVDCHDCLINLGYNVTSIQASGEESIQRAEEEHPDAVLMDIHLRDKMDGIEAAEQIYSRFKIPVVFLSAYGDRNLLERAKQVGSYGYLIKPFEEQELAAMLEMTLYKAKMEKEQEQIKALRSQMQNMESIGILAGGLAHDFNNLLFMIAGNIDLVENSLQSSDPARENLQAAQTACFKAKELTQKLIIFSKGARPVKEKTDIGELIKNSVLAVFKESHVHLEFSISDNMHTIEIDAHQIKLVVDNIALNAKEAMHNKGVFKVTCKNIDITKEDNLALPSGKYIKISFKDQGWGIPAKNIEKIFDPYFSTKDMGIKKGQGLGLAVCHSIITRHDGIIIAKSYPGAGAEFIIYLPFAADRKRI